MDTRWIKLAGGTVAHRESSTGERTLCGKRVTNFGLVGNSRIKRCDRCKKIEAQLKRQAYQEEREDVAREKWLRGVRSRVTAFLHDVLRDVAPVGTIERIMRDAELREPSGIQMKFNYDNEILERMASVYAERLLKSGDM